MCNKCVHVFDCHCNRLQPTATHCNPLQLTATRCNTQSTGTGAGSQFFSVEHCNALPSAIQCNALPSAIQCPQSLTGIHCLVQHTLYSFALRYCILVQCTICCNTLSIVFPIHFDRRKTPPLGGFFVGCFPDQEPCVRDFTTRCDRRISSWNLLHTALDQ